MGATLPSAIAVGEQSGAASLMSRRRRTDHEHERESGLVTAGAELRLLRVEPSTCVTCSWWCAGHVVSVTAELLLASCLMRLSSLGRAGRVAPLGGVVVGIAVPDVHKRKAPRLSIGFASCAKAVGRPGVRRQPQLCNAPRWTFRYSHSRLGAASSAE